MQREGVTYVLHHIGIPTNLHLVGEESAPNGMSTRHDCSGPVPIEWHRFEQDSSVHPLMKNVPHLAFKVSDLAAAIEGHVVILGPYEPTPGHRVAIIDNNGAPIELVEIQGADPPRLL